MLDHTLRAYKDDLLRPAATLMGHISPNAITVVALVLGLGAAGAAAAQAYWLALGLWLLNRLFDGLDGTVARTRGQQSDFGGYLDILLDFVVYAALPIALYWSNQNSANALALAFLLASFYVNSASWMYLSALLEKRAAGAAVHGELTSVTMPDGLIGGVETILFFCIFLIFPGALPWLFTTMAIAVLAGVGLRLHWARRNL